MGIKKYMGIIRRRTECRICHNGGLMTLIHLGTMPLAGGFLSPEQFDSEQFYPLSLSFCPHCSLIQNLDVIDPDILFRHYLYSSSVTRTLSAHFGRYAQSLKDARFVVEIGCNDGVLLRPLQNMGIKVLGIDPALNIAQMAQEKGIEVIPEYFTEDVARAIVDGHGQPDIITASNVFAHIDDLDTVMRGISALLAPGGTYIIETRYIADMLTGMQFDTIYHEHLSYYSIHSLSALLKRYGFGIARVDYIPMHGGAIRVFARRGESSPDLNNMLKVECRFGLNKPSTYAKFACKVEAYRRQLREFLESCEEDICGYGAAGRATILLNYCGIDSSFLEYMVDASPLRAGKYMPGVHIPIYSPQHFRRHPTANCLITAWNYADEIMNKEQSYTGQFIIPLPTIRRR